MALFEVSTDTSRFTWSSPIKDPSNTTNKVGEIMDKLADMEPDSKTIEVKVVDPHWCNKSSSNDE